MASKVVEWQNPEDCEAGLPTAWSNIDIDHHRRPAQSTVAKAMEEAMRMMGNATRIDEAERSRGSAQILRLRNILLSTDHDLPECSEFAVASAMTTIHTAAAIADLHPVAIEKSVEGGIGLYFVGGDRRYVYFELYNDGNAAYLWSKSEGAPDARDVTLATIMGHNLWIHIQKFLAGEADNVKF